MLRRRVPVSREVTTDNYRECFSLIRESALFEFGVFNIAHDGDDIEDTIEIKLGNSDLPDLLQELKEVAAHWYTVGVFLIDYFRLEVIKNDTCGRSNQSMECLREMLATWLRETDDASPAALVQALKSAGRIGLAKKMAFKYGVSVLIESNVVQPQETSPQNMTADLIKALTQLVSIAQDSIPMPIPDLNALANQRERMIIKDVQHSDLSEQLRELKDIEENVTQSFEQAKSSLESVKGQIDKLRQERESLIEKRERKELSKRWFIKLRGSNTGEDLVQLNQMIKDTEDAVAELCNQIDELEIKIKAQNEQVAKMSAQLAQKEQEKKQLEIKMDNMQKEKSSLEKKLEEDRKSFEKEMQMVQHQLCKVSIEKSHEEEKRVLENEVYKQKLGQVLLEKKHEEVRRKLEKEMYKQKLSQLAANPQHSIADQAQVAVTHESSETVLAKFKSDKLIDDIKLGKKIGSGTFGDVHEAILISSNKQVAVKTCKSSHSDSVKCQFLYEADVLRHYEHPNIVKLIGVVRLHELCIVVENVGWTFRYFLRANGSKCETAELTEMCAQVCTGMEYLESSKCVHRRVTARNCIVDRNNTVKISNFGASYGKGQLNPSDSKLRPVPVKWIAPEALKYGTYTSASDVWSFGVLLWETFSLGQEPYPGIAENKVSDKVKKGYRMDPPTNCPPPVYDVMLKCCEYESRKRPTFAELLNEMRKLTS